MASSKITTIPTINEKTGKRGTHQATIWDVPNTPFIINISPGHEDDDKPYYVVSHKHTGYAVLPCGRMTRKSVTEAAKVFFENCPEPIKVLLQSEDMEAEELQNKIMPIMKDRKNKLSFNNARNMAFLVLKDAR